ncbi:MAG: acyl-CoA carboxylase subunit beta [Candidatus Binatia bacterium]
MSDTREQKLKESEAPPPKRPSALDYRHEWEEPLARLAERKAAGAAQGTPDRIERHQARGKFTARERIALLCDQDTFVEYGVLASGALTTPGRGTETVPADGVITGYGLINGRRVYVVADDATVAGGSARGAAAYLKVSQIKRRAGEEGCPVVSLLEASAGRVQDLLGSQFAMSRGDFIEEVRASGLIPRVVALMGGGFGQPSFLAMLSDFRPIVKGTGFMGMSGPPVVEAAIGEQISQEELGGSHLQTVVTGQADYEAQDEHDCLRVIKEFLSYFPSSCYAAPPIVPATDPSDRQCDELFSLVPVNLRRGYDMRRVIAVIVDDGRSLEIKPTYAPNIITALARLGGMPVGIIANQPLYLAGTIDRPAAQKAARFIDLCDAFHLPLVFLQDVPGFLVGRQVEEDQLLTEAIRWMQVLCEATVPKITVVVRKGYGLAYFAMGGRGIEPDVIVAWPSASIAMMGPEAGVNVVYARELAQAADRQALQQKLTAGYLDAAAPYRAAELYAIDDIIDPRQTRQFLISALQGAQRKIQRQLHRKHSIGP